MSNSTSLSPSSYHHLRIGKAFGMTDVGLVRTSNEDNFLIDQQLGLVMITDGMGGHDAGEVASKEVLLAVRDFIRKIHPEDQAGDTSLFTHSSGPDTCFYDPDATYSDGIVPAIKTLSDAVEFANTQIYTQNLANQHDEGRGMGSTLTGFWQCQKDGSMVVFHVGDSRLYRFRAGELNLLTRDHTLYQQALDEGATDNLPPRNMLLQAMGPYPTVKPEIKLHPLHAGDRYLLCTDGLHGSVSERMIAEVMGSSNVTNLAQACDKLISLAKEHGSRDNITVVMLAC